MSEFRTEIKSQGLLLYLQFVLWFTSWEIEVFYPDFAQLFADSFVLCGCACWASPQISCKLFSGMNFVLLFLVQ